MSACVKCHTPCTKDKPCNCCGKLDEIAERYRKLLNDDGDTALKFFRAALDEAVAEERKALRKLWLRACREHWKDGDFLAALDARSGK